MKRAAGWILWTVLLTGCSVGEPTMPIAPIVDHFPSSAARVTLAVDDANMGARAINGSESVIGRELEGALMKARISTEAGLPIRVEVRVVNYDLHPSTPNHATITLKVRVMRNGAEQYSQTYMLEEPGPVHTYAAEMNEAAKAALYTGTRRLAAEIASDEQLQRAVGKGR